MKIGRIFTGLLLALLLAYPAVAEELEAIESIPVGKLKVLALTDARGSATAAILPELSRFPEYAPLFANGPLSVVNRAFYLEDGSRKILVDSGWGLEQQEKKGHLYALLKVAGIEPASITDVLLTHMDFDHIGGLVKDGKPYFDNATLWISQPEYEAWLAGNIQKRPEEKIKLAQDMAAIYKDRIKLFQFGSEILPGITAIDASGHTPGHTAYEIVSGPDKLVIGGDLMHIVEAQLPKPELSAIYDMDMEKAAQTRIRLLQQAVKDKSTFAGMHMEPISPVYERPDGGFMMRQPR
ncbi:MAG: MBL fold metallo-hydrolase [Desulfovibrio sp.]|nr:MBL fold metallo-hydrolase [Desulfovibrio sp.]